MKCIQNYFARFFLLLAALSASAVSHATLIDPDFDFHGGLVWGSHGAGWISNNDTAIRDFSILQAEHHVAYGEFNIDLDAAYPPTDVVFAAAVGAKGNRIASQLFVASFTTVPEPATVFLLGAGLLLLVLRRRAPAIQAI